MRRSTSPTSRSSASPNSCPARSLTSLKSSQSSTTRLSSRRSSCAAPQPPIEPFLEPTPVEQPGQGIGVGALALAAERDRRVERCRRVRSEQRGELALATVELAREAARADEQADLLAVRAQRDQHHRAKPQPGELRHRRRRSRRAARRRPRHRFAHAAPGGQRRGSGSGPCAPALHPADSTSPAVLVQQEQLARLDGQHAPQRANGNLGDREPDRAASSCRRTVAPATTGRSASRAARPSAPPAPASAARPRHRSPPEAACWSRCSARRRCPSAGRAGPPAPRPLRARPGRNRSRRKRRGRAGSRRCAPLGRSRPRRAGGRPGSSRSRERQPTRAVRARARRRQRRPRRACRTTLRAPRRRRRRRPRPMSPLRPRPRRRARTEAGRSAPPPTAALKGVPYRQDRHPEALS